jgi:glycosyltransferase involved in cell wall biosynthesis
VGYLPQHPNPHHLFDVSVLPSLSEGFPNSLVEAMAAGRPVVATRVGGVPDAVADGVTGLLVPPATPALLAAALAELLADPARRAAMGAAGSARARALFHAGTVIPLLEAMYTSAPARRVS